MPIAVVDVLLEGDCLPPLNVRKRMEHTGNMDSNLFRFNSEAKYQPGPQKAPRSGTHDVGNLAEGRIQVQSDDPQKWFGAKYPDIFEHYLLPPVSSDKLVQTWRSNPMQFWQNQFNFAVWCATTGYGVSLEDHLSAADGLLQSVYRFHVYYQIRRILVEIQTPLPQDQAWDAVNNPYDRRGYERICHEFGYSQHSDWKVGGPNQGLGRVYNYSTYIGYHPFADGEYDSSDMSFTQRTTNSVLHVDFIKQDAAGAGRAWKTFILNKSDGFTHPGVERLNDSIRTYVWAILGAQAQTRTCILGAGAAFDAQKQFLANVEDAISSPVDLPSAISCYQDVLQYARSEVDFSFGVSLYMAPGNMLLRVGKVTGYNNEIVIATDAQSLGLNSGLNRHEVAPPDAANHTGETGLVQPPASTTVKPQPTASTTPQPPASTTSESRPDEGRQTGGNSDHEDEKTALVVGGIAIGLGLLWILR